ncbi:hypothetical protein D3C86_1807450 [compost metagenome]
MVLHSKRGLITWSVKMTYDMLPQEASSAKSICSEAVQSGSRISAYFADEVMWQSITTIISHFLSS